MTIKELRKNRKLSQAALAAAIGVNVSVISHLENGRMKLSERLAAKIREVYGEEIEWTAGSEPKKMKEKAPAEELAAEEPREYANEIIIQSPMGGEITLEQVIQRLPEIAESVYIRVDQNKLWWVGEEDSWYVEIWE